MGSWKGLQKRRAAFEELDATIYGVAADTPEQTQALRDEHDIPFTMMSDPALVCREKLDAPISSPKCFYTALPLHPELRAYPEKAFLQPALFIWKGTRLVYEWRHTETLLNLFGARGRPTGVEILQIAREHLR